MLNGRASLLFYPEKMARLDVWEYDDTNSGLSAPRDQTARQRTWADLKGRIRLDYCF